MDKIKKPILYTYYLIIGYLPFHALISTYVISLVGAELYVKGLKDAVVFMLFVAALMIVATNSKSYKFKEHYVFSTLVMIFTVTVLAVALTNRQNETQDFAGLLILLRPFWIFFAGVLIANFVNYKKVESRLLRMVMLTGLGVICFGALQVTLLPKDFLTIFGYGVETIKPYQTIDNNESYVRILSTLRGPNPLGAYLAMIAPLGIHYLSKIKSRRPLKISIVSVLFTISIFGSHSRSAWLGLVLGLAVYLLLITKNKIRIIAFASVLIPLVALVFTFRNTSIIQNVFYHRDPEESSAVDSDDVRLTSLKYAIDSINEKPMGHGVGSSGPASNYGPNPTIIENQYLDIAYQIGWLGMIAFIGVIIAVGIMLYRAGSTLSYAHLSGLLSISLIGLFWPVWTDDTIVLLWWGLAGFILSSDIVRKTKKL